MELLHQLEVVAGGGGEAHGRERLGGLPQVAQIYIQRPDLYTTQKMFVSKIAEVDFFLSQVNVLVSEINKKLDQCPVESRNVILPRIYHVVSELEWTMSLSTKDSPNENEEDCTYSGALSPPLSSSSSEESLSWDNYDYYKIYYENDADDEDEDCDVKKCEDDDHGPVQFSASSDEESSRD